MGDPQHEAHGPAAELADDLVFTRRRLAESREDPIPSGVRRGRRRSASAGPLDPIAKIPEFKACAVSIMRATEAEPATSASTIIRKIENSSVQAKDWLVR